MAAAATPAGFLIPKQYPLVLATGLLMNFHVLTQAAEVGKARRRFFPIEFLEKEFGQVHSQQLGEAIQPNGYPDVGSGRYSAKLSYKDWYMFNVYQRVHLNYLEGLPFALTSLLFAGLYQPRAASVVGVIYMIMRSLYGRNYVKKGGAMNKWRRLGAMGSFLCLFVNVGIFVTYAVKSLRK